MSLPIQAQQREAILVALGAWNVHVLCLCCDWTIKSHEKKGYPGWAFGDFVRGWNLSKTQLYWGLLKKTSLFWATSNFMESIWGFFFVAPMDVSVPTHDWVVVSAAQDAELLRASQRSKANGSTAICRNLPKNWPFQHKTSGSLNYHELPILGGGSTPTITDSCISPIFKDFPYLICIVWVGVLWWPLFFEHLDVRSTSDPVEALQAFF